MRYFIDNQKQVLKKSIDLDDPITFNIDCESCYGNVPGVIQVFHYKREVEYKFSASMYCSSFINSFVQLIAHDSHSITPPYHFSDTVIKAVMCSNPNTPPGYVKDLDRSVTDLVTVAFNDTHFVVLRFSLKDHTVVVLDGLNYSIKKWKSHVIHILKEYQLVPSDEDPVMEYSGNKSGSMLMRITFGGSVAYEWTITNANVTKQADGISCGPLACYRVLQIFGYELDSGDALMRNKDYAAIRVIVMDHWNAMIKRNSHVMYALYRKNHYAKVNQFMTTESLSTNEENSRIVPETITESNKVASARAKEVSAAFVQLATNAQAQGLPTKGCFELAVAQVASRYATSNIDEVNDDRKPAAREYNDKASRFASSDFDEDNDDRKPAARESNEVPDPLNNTFSENNKDADIDFGEPFNDVMHNENEISDHNKERLDAMLKRNAHQEQQAKKAMKVYAEAVKNKGASSGAIVTLKVDHRVHSHPYGLLGVVYKAADSGGILVVCEHGIITSSGSSKDFWVPNDQYRVVALAGDKAVITTKLQEVREAVINGSYQYDKQPRISYSKYHDITIQSTSPTRKGRCSCKKGCRKSTCGCLKKGLTCHSGCGCNGNCEKEK